MAKELPYFKFTCSDWDSGNIQICSMEAQGLFMNICSLYWTRLGRLPVKLAKQRICKGYASAYQELIDEGVIKEQKELIVIEFLDEQLSEFEDNSEKRRQAARARWDKANAMQVHSKSNAIREDKIREDKSKEDNIKNIKERENKFRLQSQNFKNQFSSEMIDCFCDYWTEPNKSNTKMKFELQKTFDIERRLKTWDRNNYGNRNTNRRTDGRNTVAQDFWE